MLLCRLLVGEPIDLGATKVCRNGRNGMERYRGQARNDERLLVLNGIASHLDYRNSRRRVVPEATRKTCDV